MPRKKFRGVQTNQFTAKIRFDPVAWQAVVGNHTAYVLETRDGAKWWINRKGYGRVIDGNSTTPSGARAACRRAFARLERELKTRLGRKSKK